LYRVPEYPNKRLGEKQLPKEEVLFEEEGRGHSAVAESSSESE
jgi:hypothetical protein